MIEVMDESNDTVLGVRATGKLTATDYHDALLPAIRSLLDRFGTLNVLFLMDEDFRGWSLGAAWANTVLVLKHRRDFDKVAMVGAPRWEERCVRASGFLMSGELRTYQLDRLAAAWEWLA